MARTRTTACHRGHPWTPESTHTRPTGKRDCLSCAAIRVRRDVPLWKLTRFTPENFWPKADQSGGPDACWPWMKKRDRDGYGVAYNGRQVLAHRVAFSLANGVDAGERWVLHTCDNPPCVNPAHLYAGTARDNNRDTAAKGRAWWIRYRQQGQPETAAEAGRA